MLRLRARCMLQEFILQTSQISELIGLALLLLTVYSMDIWCVGSTGGTTGFIGVLYKAKTGSVATGVSNNSFEIPELFGLYQNNPNPFNTITKIDFTIPFSCYTSLKVYDVLGEEVAT